MHNSILKAILLVCLVSLLVGIEPQQPVIAAPQVRAQVTQRGNFIIIGNTLGHDCNAEVPAPVVGTVGNCGVNTADSAPDVFWRADSPAAGQAQANTTILPTQARSTAFLSLPVDATVTHAYLYWAATLSTASSDNTATLEFNGAPLASLTAIDTVQSTNNSYRAVADVTALVIANGSGAYRVSDVEVVNWINANNNTSFGAWWMVVVFQSPTEVVRTITINDGLDAVSNSLPQTISLSGFKIPQTGIGGSLGVVGLEGDSAITGDSLSFNGNILSDAQNPANNFFNSTRSAFGSPVSVTGDLPQLTGGPASMSGIDIDIVDVSPYLAAGQTSASVLASSSGDVYWLATLVTAINTEFEPLLEPSTKTAIDLNGGELMPGDVIEYNFSITNNGTEIATQVILSDTLPLGITYLPGTLEIVSGPGAGVKTDQAGDDQAEYSIANRRVTMRLGTGASSTQGGTLDIGQTMQVRFRVTLDAVCRGALTISNQASLSTVGQVSTISYQYLTDGDIDTPDNQPTTLNINFRCLLVSLLGNGSGQVTSDPPGIACPGDCIHVLPEGAAITLTATANPDSVFSGWDGSVTGTTNPLALVVSGNPWLSVTFTTNKLFLPLITIP